MDKNKNADISFGANGPSHLSLGDEEKNEV